jgi:hypothetical protein
MGPGTAEGCWDHCWTHWLTVALTVGRRVTEERVRPPRERWKIFVFVRRFRYNAEARGTSQTAFPPGRQSLRTTGWGRVLRPWPRPRTSALPQSRAGGEQGRYGGGASSWPVPAFSLAASKRRAGPGGGARPQGRARPVPAFTALGTSSGCRLCKGSRVVRGRA